MGILLQCYVVDSYTWINRIFLKQITSSFLVNPNPRECLLGMVILDFRTEDTIHMFTIWRVPRVGQNQKAQFNWKNILTKYRIKKRKVIKIGYFQFSKFIFDVVVRVLLLTTTTTNFSFMPHHIPAYTRFSKIIIIENMKLLLTMCML